MAETDETAVRPDDGRTPDERARSLEPMLTDSDARVRKSAVVALGRIKSSVATELLCRALEDAEEGVRALACQALAREADAACVGALLSHRHDECAGVRAGVLWGLANVVAHAGLTDVQRAELFTPIAVMAFDPDDGVRADAAAVLGTLRDARATDALTVLLEDDVTRVRANACAALAATDDEAGEQLLLERLSQAGEDTLVKVSALDALARRCERNEGVGERVLSALLVCSTDSDLDVSSTAVWALGFACGAQSASRDQVQAVLEGALAGEAEWGARYAVESLARIHDDRAHATLAAFDASTSALPDILAPLVAQALATFE